MCCIRISAGSSLWGSIKCLRTVVIMADATWKSGIELNSLFFLQIRKEKNIWQNRITPHLNVFSTVYAPYTLFSHEWEAARYLYIHRHVYSSSMGFSSACKLFVRASSWASVNPPWSKCGVSVESRTKEIKANPQTGWRTKLISLRLKKVLGSYWKDRDHLFGWLHTAVKGA